jgi:cell wall-associated NlpC family hydrolase
MTRDGLVETDVFGEHQKRVSRRFENEDFSRHRRGEEEAREEPAEKKAKRADSWREKEESGELAEDAAGELEGIKSSDAPGKEAVSRIRTGRYAKTEAAYAMGKSLQERHESRQQERTKSRLKQKQKQQRLDGEPSVQSDAFADAKDSIKKKRKKEQTMQAARKQGRLSFTDELTGSKDGMMKRSADMAVSIAGAKVHQKLDEESEDNSAMQAVHMGERLMEYSVGKAGSRAGRMHDTSRRTRLRENSLDTSEEVAGRFQSVGRNAKKSAADAKRHAMQKQMVKKEYQRAAYQAAKTGDASVTAGKRITEIAVQQTQIITTSLKNMVVRRRSFLVCGIALLMVFVLMMVGLGSCTAMLQGSSTPIISTTYASTDEDIYAVENAYSALESALNAQINRMESTHGGYDEYDYQVDEISHNPYHLISYFTAKYGEFTYAQVKGEVEEIFRQQYSLSVDSIKETVTETKTVKVGESLGQVVTSGYCNCSICCGVWAGGATASGVYPTANHTIAVDASDPFVPIGTKVVMNGVEYTVEDTGAFASYGVQFDVYYDNHSAASAHGHQTWEAYIADSNGSQEVEVTTTQEVNRLNTTLTNKGLDAVLRSRMTEDEQKRYTFYNLTYGNRDYLFDVDTLPSYSSDGYTYEIPPEALSDQKFAKMIKEAEKYLGYPYVWGGSSPSTSFDCSGFVSWVINNSGNGWNYGRLTADGLLGICTVVSPSEAQPGDLIFFQGTYNTPGASHVGIYVGNGMMIHCGNPIQYTSINTSYWQEHFYHFGRLP